jgi:shikimate dehydrogenase
VGVDLTVGSLEFRQLDGQPDVVISTLPGGTALEVEFPPELRRGAPLLDVSYEPWPSPLAASWLSVGGRVSSGLEMLAHQALAQVRIFVGGDPTLELLGDAAVLEAMRASIGLPASATTA